MTDWKCVRCGKCCKRVVLNISSLPEDEKLWLSYHEKVLIDGNMLILRLKCKHLKKRNNKYICDIHEKRPEMCKEAGERECEAAKGIFEMEGV